MNLKPINIENYSRIVILTGAGISAASGLPTYRGSDGLMNEEVKWLSDAKNLPQSLPKLWEHYAQLRHSAMLAQPNATHKAIATFQTQYSSTRSIILITQNIDGLHQRAGSQDVIELHGSVMRSRCINTDCSLAPFDDTSIPETVPACPVCNNSLRPDIVLFSEMIPALADWQAKRSLRDCDLFIAVGTSGTVWPASSFVSSASYVGARTILVNLTAMMPKNPYFQEEYIGKAEELLPVLLGVV